MPAAGLSGITSITRFRWGAKNLPILGFVGFMITFGWKEYFAPAILVTAFGGHWGNMAARFILWIFVVAVWPVCIRKWAND